MEKEEIQRIITLSNACAPSGHEQESALAAIEELESVCSVHQDSIGNVWIDDSSEENSILLDAHLDEVGFIIQAIRDDGMLTFLPLGGFEAKNILSCPVTILTRDGRKISAIVSTRPPHFAPAAAQEISHDSLVMDPGTTCREETIALGIAPGDFVVPEVKCTYDKERDIFTGKAFDCRIGMAALMETIRRCKKLETPLPVKAILTAQEEVGERGMQCAIASIHAKAAIVFEGCPADDTFTPAWASQTGLKKGPMLRHFDRSMITHPGFMDFAMKTAARAGIPLQLAVRKGGGTNGGILHTHDIPAIVIGIPVRYAHSSVGYCSGRDYENAVSLAVEIIRHLDQAVLDGLHHPF